MTKLSLKERLRRQSQEPRDYRAEFERYLLEQPPSQSDYALLLAGAKIAVCWREVVSLFKAAKSCYIAR